MDVYQFREVLFRIVSRDLKIKYKRTFLGYFWSLLNPILQLSVLTVVFSHAMRLGMKDYTLYLFSGLIAWTFFQTTLALSSTSILENENFIKKIYIPKLLFPLSRVLLRLIDFVFSLVALTLLGLALGFPLQPTLLLVPIAVCLLVLFTLGSGVIASVLTVYFRDVEYLLGVFLQLLYFATPILYPPQIIPERYQPLVQLNPLHSQILIFQKLIYYGRIPTALEWGTAAASAFFLFGLGIWMLFWFDEDLVFRM